MSAELQEQPVLSMTNHPGLVNPATRTIAEPKVQITGYKKPESQHGQKQYF